MQISMQHYVRAEKRLLHTVAAEKPRILIAHQQSMQDCSWRLSACALRPRHPYTLAASCKPLAKSRLFISYAHYISDDVGMIDVCQSKSVGGSYEGVEPMGLLWSLQVSGLNPDALDPYSKAYNEKVFVKHDVTTPLDVALTLHEGHVNIDGDSVSANPIAEQVVQRLYLNPDTKRILVREGRLRGTIFAPKGQGPFPAILDLYGGGGGLVESRAALLASHGYVAYALPYFAYADLHPSLANNIDIEYFIEAIDYLLALPNVNKHGVGILGLCFGGQLAMQVALACKKVKAVVNINGCSYMHLFDNGLPVIINGNQIPHYGYFTMPKSCPKGFEFIDAYPATRELCVPVEQATWCNFLFINGQDDRSMSWKHGQYLHERFMGFPESRSRLVVYPNAGHLIQPPYSPPVDSRWLQSMKKTLSYGGTLKDHAQAQEKAWLEVLKHFSQLNVSGKTLASL